MVRYVVPKTFVLGKYIRFLPVVVESAARRLPWELWMVKGGQLVYIKASEVARKMDRERLRTGIRRKKRGGIGPLSVRTWRRVAHLLLFSVDWGRLHSAVQIS
jgi:hypothetical protein